MSPTPPGPGYPCNLIPLPDLQLVTASKLTGSCVLGRTYREEKMGEGSNVLAPLLDIIESSGVSEELLQREPVPWGVLAQLTAWEAHYRDLCSGLRACLKLTVTCHQLLQVLDIYAT
ncbi:unnamed protein product [Urochloa humidicola]